MASHLRDIDITQDFNPILNKFFNLTSFFFIYFFGRDPSVVSKSSRGTSALGGRAPIGGWLVAGDGAAGRRAGRGRVSAPLRQLLETSRLRSRLYQDRIIPYARFLEFLILQLHY